MVYLISSLEQEMGFSSSTPVSGEQEADAALLSRANRNYLEGIWELERRTPGATIERWQGAAAIRTSIPSSVSNVLFVESEPTDSRALIEDAMNFFGPRTPWRLISVPTSRDGLKSAARQAGMKSKPGDPGMILHPLVTGPADIGAKGTLQIRQVTGPNDLGDFWKAAGRGFNMPRFALRTVLPDVPPDDASPDGVILRLFVGYENGRPVATSALVVSQKIAGIFFVGVDRSARRRGYGRAITEAAIESGRTEHCDASFLAATKMGMPLYEKMGYRKITDYPEWTKQPSRLDLIRSYVGFASSTLRRS